MDYDGAMGVPITFLDKYNPDQFEIMGSGSQSGCREARREAVTPSKANTGTLGRKADPSVRTSTTATASYRGHLRAHRSSGTSG